MKALAKQSKKVCSAREVPLDSALLLQSQFHTRMSPMEQQNEQFKQFADMRTHFLIV